MDSIAIRLNVSKLSLNDIETHLWYLQKEESLSSVSLSTLRMTIKKNCISYMGLADTNWSSQDIRVHFLV